jgi:hypothetical protein
MRGSQLIRGSFDRGARLPLGATVALASCQGVDQRTLWFDPHSLFFHAKDWPASPYMGLAMPIETSDRAVVHVVDDGALLRAASEGRFRSAGLATISNGAARDFLSPAARHVGQQPARAARTGYDLADTGRSCIGMVRSSKGPAAVCATYMQDRHKRRQRGTPQRTAAEVKSCFRFTSFSA